MGKAHDGAAPTSLAEQQDQLCALCLVVCPQPMQGGLQSVIQLTAVLEEGLAKKEEESNMLLMKTAERPWLYPIL